MPLGERGRHNDGRHYDLIWWNSVGHDNLQHPYPTWVPEWFQLDTPTRYNAVLLDYLHELVDRSPTGFNDIITRLRLWVRKAMDNALRRRNRITNITTEQISGGRRGRSLRYRPY